MATANLFGRGTVAVPTRSYDSRAARLLRLVVRREHRPRLCNRNVLLAAQVSCEDGRVAEQIILHPYFPKRRSRHTAPSAASQLAVERRKIDTVVARAFARALFGAEHLTAASSERGLRRWFAATPQRSWYARLYTERQLLPSKCRRPASTRVSVERVRGMAAGASGMGMPRRGGLSVSVHNVIGCMSGSRRPYTSAPIRIGRQCCSTAATPTSWHAGRTTVLGGYLGAPVLHRTVARIPPCATLRRHGRPWSTSSRAVIWP